MVIKYVCPLSLHNTYGLLYHSHKVFYDCLEQTDSPTARVSNGHGQLSVAFAILKNLLVFIVFLAVMDVV